MGRVPIISLSAFSWWNASRPLVTKPVIHYPGTNSGIDLTHPLTMSDSELSEAASNPVPPDAEIERSLRRAVVKAAIVGEEYSITTIRNASEKILGLNKGFYADHAEWKARSKRIIKEQAVRTHPHTNFSP